MLDDELESESISLGNKIQRLAEERCIILRKLTSINIELNSKGHSQELVVAKN